MAWRWFARKPVDPAAREAEEHARRAREAKARAAAWDAAQAAEWAERVRIAHEVAMAQLERNGGYTDAGWSSAGEIPTVHVREGEWTDLFGRLRRPSNLGRWLGRD